MVIGNTWRGSDIVNKKKIAALMMVFMLTGCGANNVNNSGENLSTPNKTANKTANKTTNKTQGEDKEETGASDSDIETNTQDSATNREGASAEDTTSQSTNQDGTSADESTNQEGASASTRTSESTTQKPDQTKESETNILPNAEDRLHLYDIFPEKLGTTYRHTGPLDFERIEKLGFFGSWKYSSGTKYYFQGFDDSDMKDGKITYYDYVYTVFGDKLTLSMNKTDAIIFDGEAAEKGESWTSNFLTENWENIQAEYRAITWDENKIQVEITPVESAENKDFKLKKSTYTYEKGKGITSIDTEYPLENGEGYPFGISVKELNSEETKNLQMRYRWPEIDKKFIVEDEILQGYYDLSDEYFTNTINELKSRISTPYLTKEDAEETLKEYYSKMPYDSPRAVSYIWDAADAVYKVTDDPYYFIIGVDEYEKRIDKMNEIYKKDKSRNPFISSIDIMWTKDFIFSKPFINYNFKGDKKRRLDIYLDNYINIGATDKFVFEPNCEFVEHAYKEDYPEMIKGYLNYKKGEYYTRDSRDNKAVAYGVVGSLLEMEKLQASGDTRYDSYIEKLMDKLKNVVISKGKVSSLYIRSLDDYMTDSKNQKNKDEISKIIGKINRETRAYSESTGEKEESQENDIKRNRHESKLFDKLKDDYVSLEEIKEDQAIEVWNAYDLFNAVKDNAVIKVMDDIIIDFQRNTKLSGKASNYDGSFVIEGVENLTIIGDGTDPKRISAGTTWAVLNIVNSKNITFRNISLGHVNDYCQGAVIEARDSSDIKVEDCILYGCGTIGLEYNDVQNVTAVNTLIWDCSSRGIDFRGVKGAHLENLIITENGSNTIAIRECSNIEQINIITGMIDLGEEKTYFGQWEIKELSFYGVGVYSDEDIEKMIGRRLVFKKDKATAFGDDLEYLDQVIEDPNYEEKTTTRYEFQVGWKLPNKTVKNLPDEFRQVSISEEGGLSCTFIVIDDDTLLLIGGGAFLKLERVTD